MNCPESLSDPKAVEGMARFGITGRKVYGVSIPNLMGIARETGKEHNLAGQLWKSNARETRVLAGMIDDPALVTEKQMEEWVKGFDSWEVCMNLFANVKFAYKKCAEWSSRKEEFVKRAGFALMAVLAVKDKQAEDSKFERFFPIIKRESCDDRNFVRKAVNWALRQIGKRNIRLNRKAVKVDKDLVKMDCKSAKWVGSDALRELESDGVRGRF